MHTTDALEALQTDEQRHILDIVAQLRKCGLDSVLSLPQIVVCGDQSSGKSSVMEAVTGIPFPRKDNLCTRYATEIILRRATMESLTIRIIPDPDRPQNEQDDIGRFSETIVDFDELPSVMDKATKLIGIDKTTDSTTRRRAFAKDTLSVEIEGPQRPQLTLVDLPGIIQAETKDATSDDIALVSEITEHYISQSRTICLAVVSATNDYANQPILKKVRQFDPKGERTLGIITKPDRLPPGSGTEKAFLQLAKNEDVFFNLGWHVLKNRSFEESSCSLLERNASETAFFRKSIFSKLPPECVGISSLISRLSQLLFQHVRHELPTLQEDLAVALAGAKEDLTSMGISRISSGECRSYLTRLSLDYYEVCKAAADGHYEGDYFSSNTRIQPIPSLPDYLSQRRLRAVIQLMNERFVDHHRKNGYKYHIEWYEDRAKTETDDIEDVCDGLTNALTDPEQRKESDLGFTSTDIATPTRLSNSEALHWVKKILTRTRGRELAGNFNPLVIGELLWEQSSPWERLAMRHIAQVADVCRGFLADLLKEKSADDIYARLWSQIQEQLKSRYNAAAAELKNLMEDIKSYPINYNHYYKDIVKKRHHDRDGEKLSDCIEAATTLSLLPDCQSNHASASVDVKKAVELFSHHHDPDMEKHTCEEVLDCLYAIYKVTQKVFVANVTTQVVERHIVRGIESIFSPVVVNGIPDAEVQLLASEPPSAKRQREFIEDRVSRLENGHNKFRDFMRHAVA